MIIGTHVSKYIILMSRKEINKLRSALIAMVLLLSFSFPQSNSNGEDRARQTIVNGIQYRLFILSGPNNVYVARLDRQSPQVTIDSSIAQGRVSGGLETVRAMAERNDESISYWGEQWGGRNQVVVAINGFFYNLETGVPTSGQISSSWYAKRFDERENGSGFVWTLERAAFIGGCVVHNRSRQVITFLENGEVQPFDNINVPRGDDQIILYTPQYDATTQTADEGIEILVELNRPLMILPSPAMVTGVVRAVRDGLGSTPIPFDHIVMSASGSAAEIVRKTVQIGEQVGISQEIRHLDPSCKTPNPNEWSKAFASIGASYVFLKDGVIQRLGETGQILRSARTAVAYNQDFIFFLVVDGRDRLNSLGMSMVELAVFSNNYLGASWGTALDGGGSSTMVIQGQLKNNPTTEAQEANSSSRHTERAVANGLMMVNILPKKISTRFKPGDEVTIAADSEVNLRLGPGTNFPVLSTLLPGSGGVVIEHVNGLNGILAKGLYWWKVSFGEYEGWVSEEYLR